MTNRGGRPRQYGERVAVTLRLDPDTAEKLKSGAVDWNTSANRVAAVLLAGGLERLESLSRAARHRGGEYSLDDIGELIAGRVRRG
jgi:hypothetical protein